jgi:ParB family chromosome partitioning protein
MTTQSTVFAIDARDIRPNPANPRSDLGDLTDLIESIRDHGILQPLLAQRTTGRLMLLAGHRRLAAAQTLGMTHVPVLVVGEQLPDDQLVIAMAENLHRTPLSPLDEARACRALITMGRSKGDVATELARSSQWVADRLALLELPAELAAKVDSKQMPVGQAAQLGHQLRKQRHGGIVLGARAPQHFIRTHPLADAARRRCDTAGHPARGRVGVACGACWEHAIRADVLSGTAEPAPPPPPVESVGAHV